MPILMSLGGPSIAHEEEAAALTLTEGDVAAGMGAVWHKATLGSNGRYAAEAPGAAGGVTAIKNANGAVIEMKSMTPSASLKTASGGVRLGVSR
jgi:hypothetical protein